MDSDEDFKHYSSCYYDDDTDQAFYPEKSQHQLDNKSWFECDKTVVTHQQSQCPPQQLILDNTVTSSEKVRHAKNVERWMDSVELQRQIKCDVDANPLLSVSIRFLNFNYSVNHI